MMENYTTAHTPHGDESTSLLGFYARDILQNNRRELAFVLVISMILYRVYHWKKSYVSLTSIINFHVGLRRSFGPELTILSYSFIFLILVSHQDYLGHGRQVSTFSSIRKNIFGKDTEK